MTDDRWKELVQMAEKNFSDFSYYPDQDLIFETEDGSEKIGSKDILEFTNPSGKFKIVRENRPALLEKKMSFSHQQGHSAKTDYIVSDTDMVHRVRFFMEDDMGEWKEMNIHNLSMFGGANA